LNSCANLVLNYGRPFFRAESLWAGEGDIQVIGEKCECVSLQDVVRLVEVGWRSALNFHLKKLYCTFSRESVVKLFIILPQNLEFLYLAFRARSSETFFSLAFGFYPLYFLQHWDFVEAASTGIHASKAGFKFDIACQITDRAVFEQAMRMAGMTSYMNIRGARYWR
jgi:hypothetical protein